LINNGHKIPASRHWSVADSKELEKPRSGMMMMMMMMQFNLLGIKLTSGMAYTKLPIGLKLAPPL
jgi:hypothetical protein